MSSPLLTNIEDRLRSAARLRQLEEVPELLMEYRAEFDRVWSAMNDEERRRSPLRRQSLAMNAWLKAMILAFRADIATSLRGSQAARQYAGGGVGRQRERFTV